MKDDLIENLCRAMAHNEGWDWDLHYDSGRRHLRELARVAVEFFRAKGLLIQEDNGK